MKYLIFLILPFFLQAQTVQDSLQNSPVNPDTVKISLYDGSVLIGRVVSETDKVVVFETKSGIKSEIPKSQIKQRTAMTGRVVKGEVWNDDPNKTRLFFAPTGRPLNKGEGYFSVYEVFFPFLAVGITDRFTLAGGISLFPGVNQQLLYVAPKYCFFKQENVNISAGVLYMKVPEVDRGIGIVYSVGTFGGKDKSITSGFGYGFAGSDFADNPLITLGGELRVGKYTKLITENWLFPGEADHPLLSLGIRFFGEKIAADFAFMIPAGADATIPWIGFAYNF